MSINLRRPVCLAAVQGIAAHETAVFQSPVYANGGRRLHRRDLAFPVARLAVAGQCFTGFD